MHWTKRAKICVVTYKKRELRYPPTQLSPGQTNKRAGCHSAPVSKFYRNS
uniref:Uncharacterized protein n=1 Tax=Manihot esculenta TaxID=3983 RepID=A0A2C9VJ50_MANES